MRYRAILFDLDGTLLDSLADLASAANRVLVARGLPVHPEEAYRFFVGDGMATLVERILPAPLRTPALVAEAMAAFEADYGRNWQVRTCPYPGIAPMLDSLVAGGIRLSILSNKPDGFTRLCVERLLSQWSFVPLLGQRPGVPKKPDPTAALAIAAHLGVAPEAILYVGDSAVDMQTARGAGMDAVGVLWGFRTAGELRAAGAHHLIAQPKELLPLVFSSAAPPSR